MPFAEHFLVKNKKIICKTLTNIYKLYYSAYKLYYCARQLLVTEAKRNDIGLRQYYNRNSRELICQQGRYAHARQMKQAQGCTRKLKTYPGRVICGI
jgi:hypothetical protein